MQLDDALSRTFAALADPTRRAILARLLDGEATVTELAAPFSLSLPAVSRHLRVLGECGLIAQGRAAQTRPCKLRPQALAEVDEWLGSYRAFWSAGFDRMDGYLASLQAPRTKRVTNKPARAKVVTKRRRK